MRVGNQKQDQDQKFNVESWKSEVEELKVNNRQSISLDYFSQRLIYLNYFTNFVYLDYFIIVKRIFSLLFYFLKLRAALIFADYADRDFPARYEARLRRRLHGTDRRGYRSSGSGATEIRYISGTNKDMRSDLRSIGLRINFTTDFS